MELHELLKEVSQRNASDLYLIAGAVPAMTVDGVVRIPKASDGKRITPELTHRFARQLMTDWHWDEFERRRELNMAYMVPEIGRFRVNILWQRGSIGIVVRRIVENIPTLQELGLPPVLREIALADRGIVIISGATGSGKSTTMASMIDFRNHLMTGHIVTVEDPIEFVYTHKRSIVTQRELGTDTLSVEEALRNSLRQAPSVISIGEMRDAETVKFALHASETGHLVFATLHSTNATLTLERVLHFFPGAAHEQVLMQMALNLRAVVCQRLIPRINDGRACAVEILANSPRAQDLIIKGDMRGLRDFIKSGMHEGSESFDLSLYRLTKKGVITKEDALRYSDSFNELEMKFRGLGIVPGSAWEDLSDPWQQTSADFDWPEAYVGSTEKLMAERHSYSNEGAAMAPSGDSGITPQIPGAAFSRDGGRAKPPPAGVPPTRGVATRYRDMIEAATREPTPPPKEPRQTLPPVSTRPATPRPAEPPTSRQVALPKANDLRTPPPQQSGSGGVEESRQPEEPPKRKRESFAPISELEDLDIGAELDSELD